MDEFRQQHKSIGLVPTMGALHEGHLSLIKAARAQTDIVVCSIFVNPTQFNDPDDLARYPRTVEADLAKLREAACDAVFLPLVDEMYTKGETWHIELGPLENIFEGALRPGHYQGVTQVVKKLFDIVKPDIAFFGQKDFQQVLILRKMVEMLALPVTLVMCPIKREPDGLAMSSRNVYLSPEDHQLALALVKSLEQAKRSFPEKNVGDIKQEAIDFLRKEGVEPDYFEICDAHTLTPIPTAAGPDIIALVAAKVGKIRLIDNMFLRQESGY